MTTRDKNDGHNISLVEAVEALSNIADLEFDRNIGISQTHDLLIQDQKVNYRTIHWLHHQGGNLTLNMVKDIFRTVLNYLQNFYKEEYSYVTDEKTIEGIKTIMVLVGEAAKKLDKFTDIFQNTQKKSVTDLREYKQLQDFYLSRIARKIDDGVLGKWILALSQRALAPKKGPSKLVARKAMLTKHVFVDLEGVKKDTEYELFFIRKEDGTRFFSPRLIRNIKLVCDFGTYFHGHKSDDPLTDLNLLHDRCAFTFAKNMMKSLDPLLNRFYREGAGNKDNELAAHLNKTVMALLLCTNSKNLLRNNPIKSCYEYFCDFQKFLREIFHKREYEKLIAYPPQKGNILSNCLLETVHGLCYSLFVSLQGYQDISDFIHNLVNEAIQEQSSEHSDAVKKSKTLWNKIACDYSAMAKLIKRHPNGPLNKVLNMLEEGDYHYFDTLMQHNLPMEMYNMYISENKIKNIRVPAPVHQEFINKVTITDEFKAFLRSLSKNQIVNKFLMINLQDRTSWREHSRCIALEELQNHENFAKHFIVVTLSKDTEFYHQLAPYNNDNHADIFIAHFKEHLADESSGFFFPKNVHNKIFPEFVDDCMEAVHRIFFNSKNVLTRDQRLDFIELFYFFLQLKILDIVKPDAFTFTCKDSIDIGGAANAQLFAFLKILNQEKLSDSDMELLDQILYSSPIMIRERIMLPERFNRLINALKMMERVKEEHGPVNFSKIIQRVFGLFYSIPILEAKLLPSKSIVEVY